MSNIVITAKNNGKIKEIKALISSSRERKKKNLFVLEGVRLCIDAVKSGKEIKEVYFTERCESHFSTEISLLKSSAKNNYIVSEDVFKAMSDTVTPQGVICVVARAENDFEYVKGGKYIALDTLQNPDNLGAIARTAEALGIDGLIACGGCDIYNPKAQRASMGSLLRLPVKITDSLENEIETVKSLGIKAYAAVPREDAESITNADFSMGAFCIIGNEGNGIREEIIEECEAITIKMKGRAESLNAGSAASIVMWELVK